MIEALIGALVGAAGLVYLHRLAAELDEADTVVDLDDYR